MNPFHVQGFSKPLLYLRIPPVTGLADEPERYTNDRWRRVSHVHVIQRMGTQFVRVVTRILSNMV
jgi:hypothetical protein